MTPATGGAGGHPVGGAAGAGAAGTLGGAGGAAGGGAAGGSAGSAAIGGAGGSSAGGSSQAGGPGGSTAGAGGGTGGTAGSSGVAGGAGGAMGGKGGAPGACGALAGLNLIAAIAPGGASFALATADGHLEMRRWSDSSLLPINNPCYGATSIAYSPDGTVFTASNSLGAQVWRVSDGAPLTTISQLANARAIAVSNDGSVVAADKGLGPAGSYGYLYISRPAGVLSPGSDPIVGGVAVSPDGTLTAAVYWQVSGSTFHPHAYFDGIWNVSSGQRLVSTAAGNGINDVTPPVVFSRDGTLVAFGIGGDQGSSRVLHSSDGSSAGSLSLDPMAFSDDNSVILAGTPDFRASLELVPLSSGSQGGTVVFSSTDSTALAGGFGGGLTPLAVVQTTSSSALQLITNNTQSGSVPID